MPTMDLADEILSSPEFAADPGTVYCLRQIQTIDGTGRATETSTTTDISAWPYSCVVTTPSPATLVQVPELQRVSRSIQVISTFPLQVASGTYAADIVKYLGEEYTVTDLTNCMQFPTGRGYVIALCILKPLV